MQLWGELRAGGLIWAVGLDLSSVDLSVYWFLSNQIVIKAHLVKGKWQWPQATYIFYIQIASGRTKQQFEWRRSLTGHVDSPEEADKRGGQFQKNKTKTFKKKKVKRKQ